MNFIDSTIEKIKQKKRVDSQDPLICLITDRNGKNFRNITTTEVKDNYNLCSDSKIIRNHIRTRIKDRRESSLDWRFKVNSKKVTTIKNFIEVKDERIGILHTKLTKLLKYRGNEVKRKSFDNADPFRKTRDGLKNLSKNLIEA